MLQLGPLKFVDGACIPRPQGVRGHGAAVLHELRHRVNSEMPACVGHDAEAAGPPVKGFHDCSHAVHEVRSLVDVLREVHPEALVHIQRLRDRRVPQLDLAVRCKVLNVGFPIGPHTPQQLAATVGEEDLGGELVHQCSPTAGAGSHDGVGVLTIEVQDVVGIWLVLLTPGLVATADVPQLLLRGLVETQQA